MGNRGKKLLHSIKRRVSRIRHFRGHGIHSPYIYRLYREVFMSGGRSDDELQNIRYLTDTAMVIYTTNDTDDVVKSGVEEAQSSGTTVAILTPRGEKEREALCEQIVSRHRCTSVKRSHYLLLFNNHLPKQHFEL